MVQTPLDHMPPLATRFAKMVAFDLLPGRTMDLVFRRQPLPRRCNPVLDFFVTRSRLEAGKLVSDAGLPVRTDESCQQPKIHTRSAPAELPEQLVWLDLRVDDEQGNELVPRIPLTMAWGSKIRPPLHIGRPLP